MLPYLVAAGAVVLIVKELGLIKVNVKINKDTDNAITNTRTSKPKTRSDRKRREPRTETREHQTEHAKSIPPRNESESGSPSESGKESEVIENKENEQ